MGMRRMHRKAWWSLQLYFLLLRIEKEGQCRPEIQTGIRKYPFAGNPIKSIHFSHFIEILRSNQVNSPKT